MKKILSSLSLTFLLLSLTTSYSHADVLCKVKKTGAAVVRKRCKKTEVKVNIGSIGGLTTETLLDNTGPQGPQGPIGPQGPVGPKGDTGQAPFIPEVVTFRGPWSSQTSYDQFDLVSSNTPEIYFYATASGTQNLLPETNSGAWVPVAANQLNTIRKTNVTLNTPGISSLFSFIGLSGNRTASARVQYLMKANDAGSQVATESGIMQVLATSNTVTCNTQLTDKLHFGTVNSGCTPGFYNPGTKPGVSIFDNVSFNSPAPITGHEVDFKIFNVSSSSLSGGVTTPVTIRLEF